MIFEKSESNPRLLAFAVRSPWPAADDSYFDNLGIMASFDAILHMCGTKCCGCCIYEPLPGRENYASDCDSESYLVDLKDISGNSYTVPQVFIFPTDSGGPHCCCCKV